MKTSTLQAWCAGVLAGLLAGCQSALFGVVNLGTPGSGGDVDTFAFAPGRGLSLDVYRPRDVSPGAPIVVFFHGGSWRGGERGWVAFVGRALARHGAVGVVPDYRKAPAVRFPAFVDDAALAVAWARQQAAAIGGDPQRLYVMGHSAGAHIAAMLASDARYLAAVGLAPRDLAGMVGLAGPYDFEPITGRKLLEVFGPASGHAATQPINFVDGDEPGFLLLHGERDRVVEPGNSVRLAARLRAADVPVTEIRFPGLGHAGILLALAGRSGDPVLAPIIRFIGMDDRAGAEAATAAAR